MCQENGKQCSNFSILHANCRGLEHNFDKLVSLTSSAPIDTATTETWTNSANEDNYKLCGYNFEVKSRQHKHCCGVGLFISDFLKYKLRDDLCIDSPDIIESIFVELDYNNIVVREKKNCINDVLKAPQMIILLVVYIIHLVLMLQYLQPMSTRYFLKLIRKRKNVILPVTSILIYWIIKITYLRLTI